jgi:diacylglycerol kinase
MKTRSWLKLGGFILCVGVFALIAANLQNEALHTLDMRITAWLVAARSPALTLVMRGITSLCSPVVLLLICLLLMALFRKKHYSIPVAVNLMVSVSLNYSLKSVFLRERPPLIFQAVAETGFSFPSGHAMAAGAFFGFLIYMVAQAQWPARRKRALVALVALLIGLIAVSRVYLGVHYLSDVVAGLAVSTAYLLAYSAVVGLYLRAGQDAAASPAAGGKNKRLTDSFRHAFDGVAGGLKGERNMIVHFGVMALVTVFGFLLKLSEGEWLACVILFGLVIGMELINTAIETTVDICMPAPDPRARLAKDTAAGAVMAVCVAAAVAGVVIFAPKLWPMLR